MKTLGCNKATHLCPCGYYGDNKEPCRCGPELISRYQSRVSGPLLDRVDIQISVHRIEYALLRGDAKNGESSVDVRQRVIRAHEIQLDRIGVPNSQMNSKQVEKHCTLSEEQHDWLAAALDKFNLSARAIHRTLKVARTIADISASPSIEANHLREALSYRTTLKEQYRVKD